MMTRSKAQQGTSSTYGPGKASALRGILKNTTGRAEEQRVQSQQSQYTGPITRLRSKNLDLGETSGLFQGDFNRNRLNQRSRRPGVSSQEDAISRSSDSIISLSSGDSTPRSHQPGPSSQAFSGVAGTSNGSKSPQQEHGDHLNIPLLSGPQRNNVLEALVRAFPVTVPEEGICSFLESEELPALSADLKRHLTERRNQHRNEFDKSYVSVFKAECPWEPKWFTNYLTKLIVTTKHRPHIYQFIFDAKQREQGGLVMKKWKALNGFIRWSIGLGALFLFLFAICYLIDTYGEEGTTFCVPLILFTNIMANKMLFNLNGAFPSD